MTGGHMYVEMSFGINPKTTSHHIYVERSFGITPKWPADMYMSKGHIYVERSFCMHKSTRDYAYDGGNFSPLQRISLYISILKYINIVSVNPIANILFWNIYTPKTLY